MIAFGRWCRKSGADDNCSDSAIAYRVPIGKKRGPSCWDDNGGRGGKSIQAWSVRLDPAAVAGDDRIDPVVVDVAVEDLEPLATRGNGIRYP